MKISKLFSTSSSMSPPVPAENEELPNPKELHPTTYLETIIHLFKGNIGPGLFAMGYAFAKGGLILSPILTLAIAVITVYCQHILLNCSKKIREQLHDGKGECPDYAETVEKCFEIGPERYQKYSKIMSTIVNLFICVTQLGFCCIYFVFISTNMEHILESYKIHVPIRILMLIIYVPILLPCLITNLKYLAPVSLAANGCMITGFFITQYYSFRDGLEDPIDRDYYKGPQDLALYFGTAIFAFEGIALVLPLKNAMKRPKNFDRSWGVLNVGMCFVSIMFITAGFFGYLKYGDKALIGSLTLNLPYDEILAKVCKLVVALGVLMGYPLQFFIPTQIMWPTLMEKVNMTKCPVIGELIFRTMMVTITLCIALLVPRQLGSFISLIGALCSNALALAFPPIIEFLLHTDHAGRRMFIIIKNICILTIAVIGTIAGTYESLSSIIANFSLKN